MFDLLLPPLCWVCERSLRRGKVCNYCLPDYLDFQHPRCWLCFREFYYESADDICPACIADQERQQLFSSIRYIWDYSAEVRDFISVMKYQSNSGLTRIAAENLAKSLAYIYYRNYWDLIVPVPSSRGMYLKRGFNQVEELIRMIPGYKCLALKRQKNSKPQAMIKDPKERFANVKDVFYCTKDLTGKSVLLVDDLVTTGATVKSAAKCLKNAGVENIHLLSLTTKL